ncbi:MAG: cupin domain-containing protein [bacterium]|nr:cupin domain-containing protein [bacterium]
MIVSPDQVEFVAPSPGVERRVLATGGGLMSVEFRFRKGAVGAVHSHPHQQVGYIISGRFELEMNGEKQVVSAGDSYYVPSGAPHGVVALEDGVIFDVFTPQREDFK